MSSSEDMSTWRNGTKDQAKVRGRWTSKVKYFPFFAFLNRKRGNSPEDFLIIDSIKEGIRNVKMHKYMTNDMVI